MNNKSNRVGRIYYYCPCFDSIYGGAKQIYRHVEILKHAGYDAFVLHEVNDFRYSWFNSDVSICYDLGSVSKNDYVVLPEIVTEYTKQIIRTKCHIVIFNQNAYYTFDSLVNVPMLNSPIPLIYELPQLKAILTVSEDNMEYLKTVFHTVPIYRIINGINVDIFNNQFDCKKDQIAYMSRKLPNHVSQVINIVNRNRKNQKWRFVCIDNCTEEEVAAVMKNSKIFLSFAHSEGFSLPALEAIFCGCYVIGYHGNGAKEYLLRDFASPIEYNHIYEFAFELLKVMDAYGINNIIKEKTEAALSYCKERYSLVVEHNSVIDAWSDIFNQ